MNKLINTYPKTFGYFVFVFSSFVFATPDGYKKWLELTRDKNFINLVKMCFRSGADQALHAAFLPVLIPFCALVLLHKKGYIGSRT